MSDPSTPASSAKPLQFDTAEFAPGESQAGELSCTACQRPLATPYFEANGQKICATCKDAVLAARSGNPFVAFLKAGIFGMLAGIAGCAIYYGVLAVTGYEVGLIAIAVGLMVGFAVRAGSGNRGGWLYQLMAMIITYGSIVASYVPLIVREMTTSDNEDVKQIPTVIAAIIAWFIAWFAPFLGLPQNLIGVLIIGFGVYEAWKINQRQSITVTGPFSLTAPTDVNAPPVPYVQPNSYPT